MYRFLVVEDDDNIRNAIRMSLKDVAMDIVESRTVSETVSILDGNGINCMVIDVNLPDGTAYEVFDHMCDNNMFVPTIVISAGNFEPPDRAYDSGYIKFVDKPFSIKSLKDTMVCATKACHAANNLSSLVDELHNQAIIMESNLEKLNGLGI